MISTSPSHRDHADAPAKRTDEPEYYNITEVASLLGVSRVTVSRWIRHGRLPVARLGHRTTRIRREDLKRLLSEHEVGPRHQQPGFASTLSRHSDSAGRDIGPSAHIVQFYDSDAPLLESVSRYIAAGLAVGGVGVVIATEAHRLGLDDRLRADGLDVDDARDRGHYVDLDAAEVLERILVDGEPDAGRFADLIGTLIERAVAGGRTVHAFGEMVALLAAEGNCAAAIRLESLWNGLQRVRPFSLFCAYPMDVLSGSAYADVLGDVCDEHDRVIPMESYTRLDVLDARLREIARLQQLAASLEAEVAARRLAEERLRGRERELRDFFENATEGLHWVGADGRIIWANRAELELLGYSADEYIGRPIAEFHADPEIITDILRRLAAGEELRNYEARLRARDGSIRHVLINSNVYREDGRFIHTRCFTHDITARKLAEEASLRLAAIVESSDDAIIGKTLDGTITSWNAGAERLYGYAADEVIGRPIALLIPDDRPDELPSIMDRLRRGVRIDHYETERVRKDGQRLTVSVTISPVRDPAGRVIGASAIARDVTERKRLEREREELLAREREAHAQAAVALRLRDEFLAIAAHELRTPIAALKGHAQVAERRLNRTGQLEPERVAETLRAIAGQSDKLNRLLGRLLDISRLEGGKLQLERQTTDVPALVEQVLAASRARVAGHPITLAAPSGLEADIDPLRMEQVLTNLVDNAIKYSPDGGPVEIAVCRSSDSTLEIAVRDHGLGIPEARRERIFERYYQAHGDGYRSGLGLGLYVSCQIVELHGGEIRAEFPEDGGSCFVVRLPLSH